MEFRRGFTTNDFECRSLLTLASTFTIRLRLPGGVRKYTIQWFLGGTCGDAAHAFPPFGDKVPPGDSRRLLSKAKKVRQYNAQIQRGETKMPTLC
jgi:hypothetical protein